MLSLHEYEKYYLAISRIENLTSNLSNKVTIILINDLTVVKE